MTTRRSVSVAWLSALLLLLSVFAAAPAFAATTCTLESDLVTLKVTVDTEGAKISRVGDNIVVTTATGTTDLCPSAVGSEHTVLDINSINVLKASGATAPPVIIDLSGGDFAPGFSTESGTDEIEIYLQARTTPTSGLVVTIQGSTSGDDWGFSDKGVRLNSDTDEDVLGGSSTTWTTSTTLSVVSLTANGLAGNDTFLQGTTKSAEVLNGGDGTDTVDYSGRTASITVTLGTTPASSDGEPSEDDEVAGDIERVIGGGGNDSITAPTGATTTDYRFEGGAGNDTLTGGAASDRLLGEAGNDTLVGGDGRDFLNGGAGTDSESGGLGNDVFEQEAASNGNDSLDGGDGTDTVRYNLRLTGVRVTPDGTANDGACTTATCAAASENDNVSATTEKVQGSKVADVILAPNASATNFRFEGGAGNDQLIGSDGKDKLFGGSGNDDIRGGANADYLSGGSGADTQVGGAGNDNLNGGSDDDKMNGEAGTDRLSGGSGDDQLWGDGDIAKVKDTIYGGSQSTTGSDKCEADPKDVRSGCEAKVLSANAPTS